MEMYFCMLSWKKFLSVILVWIESRELKINRKWFPILLLLLLFFLSFAGLPIDRWWQNLCTPSLVSMLQPLATCSYEGFVVISCTMGRGMNVFIHKFYWKTKQCNENLLKMSNCPRSVPDHQEHDELPSVSLAGEELQQADGSCAVGFSDFGSRWNLQHIFCL